MAIIADACKTKARSRGDTAKRRWDAGELSNKGGIICDGVSVAAMGRLSGGVVCGMSVAACGRPNIDR